MRNILPLLKGIFFSFIGIIIFLSLFSYNPADLPFLIYPPNKFVNNFVGIVGAYIGFCLFFLFGYAAYFFSFYFFCLGLDKFNLLRFRGIAVNRLVRIISFLFFIVFFSTFIGLFNDKVTPKLYLPNAGVIGLYLARLFKEYFGNLGAFITLMLLLVLGVLLLFGLFFIDIFPMLKKILFGFIKFIKLLFKFLKRKDYKINNVEKKKIEKQKKEINIKPQITLYTPNIPVPKTDSQPKEKKPEVLIDKVKVREDIKEVKLPSKKYDPMTYKLPPYEILKVPPSLDYREVKENIETSIKNLEDTLSDFGVEAKVVSVQKGPVVTMYELQPQAGVKINKISTLSDDIALAMKSSSVRIVAPIPGRGTVGVEIPNEKKHLVYLREVLEEKAFAQMQSKLTLAIGKDVSGNPVISDLIEMPHLLIAGTTGSGKTICVNSIISSILFKSKPDEVKFILIDPKIVELAHFSNIPHLLCPIISEAKKATAALSWTVQEMERRYQLLAQEGVRNIELYNKTDKKMPYIVIVVDELADLMVVARENIELSIQRLAQLSRAVGIHLILATQRPSVDVITGVIKANFPARISFKVSSKVDSRTVLDLIGAEKLLGEGDLLFLKPTSSKLIRAQGSFIDDEDIKTLTDFIRQQGAPVYEDGIQELEKKNVVNVEEDELFDEAVKVVLQAKQASASILQRRLRIGYTRAARLLDLMEKAGIVGAFCGSKAREILVDADTYLKEKGYL